MKTNVVNGNQERYLGLYRDIDLRVIYVSITGFKTLLEHLEGLGN